MRKLIVAACGLVFLVGCVAPEGSADQASNEEVTSDADLVSIETENSKLREELASSKAPAKQKVSASADKPTKKTESKPETELALATKSAVKTVPAEKAEAKPAKKPELKVAKKKELLILEDRTDDGQLVFCEATIVGNSDTTDSWLFHAIFDKGQVIRVAGLKRLSKDGVLSWLVAKKPVLVSYSPVGVRVDKLHFIRPNGTKEAGGYAPVVTVSSTKISFEDKNFDLFDLSKVWEVITDPSKKIAYYMEGHSKDGRYLVGDTWVMVDSQTFLPQNTGGLNVFSTAFDSPAGVYAKPEKRPYEGQDTYNIELCVTPQAIKAWRDKRMAAAQK